MTAIQTRYYSEIADDANMERQKVHLDHRIECSKKITALLTSWMYNVIIGGGTLMLGASFICLTYMIARYLLAIIKIA